MGQFAEMIFQPHRPQPLASQITAGSVTEIRQQIGSHLHVLLGTQATQQIVALKNHADRATQLLTFASGGALEFKAEHSHRTIHHLAQGSHQGQQGGFAAAGGAGQQHHFTGVDAEIHPLNHLAPVGAVAIPVVEPLQLHAGLGGNRSGGGGKQAGKHGGQKISAGSASASLRIAMAADPMHMARINTNTSRERSVFISTGSLVPLRTRA